VGLLRGTVDPWRLGPPRHGHSGVAMERLMTIEEVAEYLRVPVLTIRWLRQEGRFAPAVKVGRRLLWEESAVNRWVEANREPVA
jgi:excisionase family DNA binding protein